MSKSEVAAGCGVGEEARAAESSGESPAATIPPVPCMDCGAEVPRRTGGKRRRCDTCKRRHNVAKVMEWQRRNPEKVRGYERAYRERKKAARATE